MPTYTYQEVSHREQRRVPCSGCGKKLTRTRTFTNTLSPFNKNPDGTVRTYAEVLAKVKAEGAQWQPTDVQCRACDPPPPPPPIDTVRVDTTVSYPVGAGHRKWEIVRASNPDEAREKAIAAIRREIELAEQKLAAVDQWTYRCWPRQECKHGDAGCFPAEVEAVTP